MPNRKSRNKSKKTQQIAYKAESRLTKNKRNKAERHKKKHPNDKTKTGEEVSYNPNRKKQAEKQKFKIVERNKKHGFE